jgi:hypothetical protein
MGSREEPLTPHYIVLRNPFGEMIPIDIESDSKTSICEKLRGQQSFFSEIVLYTGQ